MPDRVEVTFCRACQGEIQAQAIRCKHCGARRDAIDASETQAPTSAPTRLAAWAVWLLAAILAWQVIAALTLQRSETATVQAWEYRVEKFRDSEWDLTAGEPNRLGAAGWEIISARRAGSEYDIGYECILRRRR